MFALTALKWAGSVGRRCQSTNQYLATFIQNEIQLLIIPKDVLFPKCYNCFPYLVIIYIQREISFQGL